MSAESNYSFTTKINGDLFTVRGDDYDTFSTNLATAAVNIGALLTDIGLLQGASAAAPLVTGAAPIPAAPAAAPAQTWTATPPAAPAPGGEHLCEHGQPMKLIPAGIAKSTGRPYKAFYACAQPRGQQCNSRVTV